MRHHHRQAVPLPAHQGLGAALAGRTRLEQQAQGLFWHVTSQGRKGRCSGAPWLAVGGWGASPEITHYCANIAM